MKYLLGQKTKTVAAGKARDKCSRYLVIGANVCTSCLSYASAHFRALKLKILYDLKICWM